MHMRVDDHAWAPLAIPSRPDELFGQTCCDGNPRHGDTTVAPAR
jgi:hypothetical protein